MATTLDTAVTEVLDRLGDLEGKVWTTAETRLYLQDGYDQFCSRVKCLFDVFIIENLPPVANWQTDLEKYLAEQRSGWGLTDERFHFTDDSERDNGPTDNRGIGGAYSGPASMTSPGDRNFHATVDGSAGGVTHYVLGGTLPQSTVGILRLAYDQETLPGITEARMNEIDAEWEGRTGERPSWFIVDNSGLFYVRLVPASDGGAVYDSTDGSWGTLRYTDDTTVTADTVGTGGFGILRYRTGVHATHGPWGTPRRIHPNANNTKVEVFRLGRDLENYPFELPDAYIRYVYYYAMARLLGKDGPGQDIALAEHYMERFEMGVDRGVKRHDRMMPEREGSLGKSGEGLPFALGDPQPSDDDMTAPT